MRILDIIREETSKFQGQTIISWDFLILNFDVYVQAVTTTDPETGMRSRTIVIPDKELHRWQ